MKDKVNFHNNNKELIMIMTGYEVLVTTSEINHIRSDNCQGNTRVLLRNSWKRFAYWLQVTQTTMNW